MQDFFLNFLAFSVNFSFYGLLLQSCFHFVLGRVHSRNRVIAKRLAVTTHFLLCLMFFPLIFCFFLCHHTFFDFCVNSRGSAFVRVSSCRQLFAIYRIFSPLVQAEFSCVSMIPVFQTPFNYCNGVGALRLDCVDCCTVRLYCVGVL